MMRSSGAEPAGDCIDPSIDPPVRGEEALRRPQLGLPGVWCRKGELSQLNNWEYCPGFIVFW